MKSALSLQELRSKDLSGLTKLIDELRGKLDRARIDATLATDKNHRTVRTLRKQLAQALTVMNEKELE